MPAQNLRPTTPFLPPPTPPWETYDVDGPAQPCPTCGVVPTCVYVTPTRRGAAVHVTYDVMLAPCGHAVARATYRTSRPDDPDDAPPHGWSFEPIA
jgi:hypothetical protein